MSNPASLQIVARKDPKRHVASPQMRALIAEDCRRRGCVNAAKVWGITVGAAMDCRIEDLEKTIRRAEAWIRAQQQKAA